MVYSLPANGINKLFDTAANLTHIYLLKTKIILEGNSYESFIDKKHIVEEAQTALANTFAEVLSDCPKFSEAATSISFFVKALCGNLLVCLKKTVRC